jgi:EAL domain-containing protein (putative c-di-GMP-specific phosphodiesterase class I)
MQHALEMIASKAVAYLEHYPETGEGAHRLLLDHFPFCIGRSASAHYCINSRHVSNNHAEIHNRGEELIIRDPGSTNGTFVNGQRIKEAVLSHGDIVHIAHKEFRFVQDSTFTPVQDVVVTDQRSGPLPASVIQNSALIKELLAKQNVLTLFQPIVDPRTNEIIGFEALGRGTHDKLSASPVELFTIAAACNLAADLSRLFRRKALQAAACLPSAARIFLNLHPSELINHTLARTLDTLTEGQGQRQIVLELHEEAVSSPVEMVKLREQLGRLGIELAYDDFGVGQSRLTELAEAPPDYIKLDKSLIRDLHLAPARQELVGALARVSTDLGIRVIAEGIEMPDEANICLRLGCHFVQGYFFGRPRQYC